MMRSQEFLDKCKALYITAHSERLADGLLGATANFNNQLALLFRYREPQDKCKHYITMEWECANRFFSDTLEMKVFLKLTPADVAAMAQAVYLHQQEATVLQRHLNELPLELKSTITHVIEERLANSR